MSKMIKRMDNDRFNALVELDGNYFYLDACDTVFDGYEMMAFTCDENGNNVDWAGVCQIRYDDYLDMIIDFVNACDHLEDYLEE